jgi:hypothetical protein
MCPFLPGRFSTPTTAAQIFQSLTAEKPTSAVIHNQTVRASQSQRVQWQFADLEAVDQHVT